MSPQEECCSNDTSSSNMLTARSLIDQSLKACKTRAVLTEAQAVEIFLIKICNDVVLKPSRQSAAGVARQFGVSDKAVRDIWTGRTWFRELMHLDPGRAAMPERLKRPGRPRGRRNTQQRTRVDWFFGGSKASDGDYHDDVYPGLSPVTSPQIETFGPDPQHMRKPPTHPTTNQQVADVLEGSPLLASSGLPCSREPAAPLPESSSADDPFRDDWRFWPPAFAADLDGGSSDGAKAEAGVAIEEGWEETAVMLWGRWAEDADPPSAPNCLDMPF